ncbi:MAG: response regulator [Chloroflexi bacterium]|nr:response regulator [Chloroflexota bacterium]
MSLVLIVDDDSSVRNELTEFVEEQGHEVITAGDGHEGLQSAKNFAPDVIVVDSSMPVMDGLELLEKLRQAKETFHVPLIMMTDHENPREKQRAQQYGVIDYLQKPVGKEDIQLRIKWALKAGSVIPAVPWDLSGSDGAGGSDGIGLDSAGSKKETRPAQTRYKEEPNESVVEITPKSGGTVQSQTGNVAVEIPAGSVPDTVGIMVSETDQLKKPDEHTLRLRLGKRATDIRVADQTGARIAGMQLKSPARIGIKVDPKEVSDGGKNRVLRVQEYDLKTDSWTEVATYVDEEEGIAYTRRDRLGRAPTLIKGRVLVLETDEVEFPKLASALEGSSFQVLREIVASKVKLRIAKEKPIIVIIGLGIAGNTGARLLREIKFNPDIRNVTVIPIVQPDGAEAYADAISIGAREVILGPVRIGELQFRVNSAYKAIAARRKRGSVAKSKARPGAAGPQQKPVVKNPQRSSVPPSGPVPRGRPVRVRRHPDGRRVEGQPPSPIQARPAVRGVVPKRKKAA